jgi:hypothetical protein
MEMEKFIRIMGDPVLSHENLEFILGILNKGYSILSFPDGDSIHLYTFSLGRSSKG